MATEKQSASTFRIGYFEMDSLEAHYNYFKDAEAQAKSKEVAMNNEVVDGNTCFTAQPRVRLPRTTVVHSNVGRCFDSAGALGGIPRQRALAMGY